MKTRVFGYKGVLGATTDLEKGKFLNDPMAIGQCGCIVSIDELEINQEAIDLLRTATVGSDDIAEIMLGKNYICLLGFHKHIIDLEITSSCDKTLLNRLIPTTFDIDPDFINFVEKNDD